MESKNSIKSAILLALAITLLWLGSIHLMNWHIPDSAKRGTFGDSFGAVNSLFSGLALAGIIFTIFLQRQELSLQREELKLTRNELKRSADVQVQSQMELAKQSLNMKRTAELNALSTLIENIKSSETYLRARIRTDDNARELNELSSEKEHYVMRVKNILDQKSVN